MDCDGVRRWDNHDRAYSADSGSDDSPVLTHRYDRRHYAAYTREGKEERERRSTLSVLAKFFLVSSAMILFCVLMYIPVYNKANYQMPKGIVQGWSISKNRDTKLYVQPNNVTTIHEPTAVCTKETNKNKLFLLIVVCSSIEHFDRRLAIRETWGDYESYIESARVFKEIKERYKKYNYTHDLYPNEFERVTTNQSDDNNNTTIEIRSKRDINGFSDLLPELARALKKNLDSKNNEKVEEVEENRFDNVEDEPVLPEFDMNEVIGDEKKETTDYDYNYESNIMRIPPKGEEEENEESPNLEKILNLLKESQTLEENSEETGNSEIDFKLVFLLGLPAKDNSTEIQNRIEAEVKEYGDIIQEGFIDSYNNLTLKSIMMLKWITNRCNDSVRYILKSDDDMYINMPNLMQDLRNRSRHFDAHSTPGQKEYLLIGDLITGARPVMDVTNKWYSPRYMYSGRVYPRYVSGTAYALSAAAGSAIYKAALRTTYFHLEDIYITGMCSSRASPRVVPRNDPLFSYRAAPSRDVTCYAHARATTHHLHARQMRQVWRGLKDAKEVDRCERMRLTQVRRDRMRPKTTTKRKLTKLPVKRAFHISGT